ncbi:transcriptional regulator [Actinomycetospora sp. DW7H6]|uniref:Transcriptional regulator n=2 Tax=Actinomycetospora lemnae TaxID=3019891 RepID=A0ABT5SQD4_9PSEU|nr:metalloregulator ArsR/SmtB family transcription factor [Actinomycetospora sp. DW7H6]MDD7964685.1 transcriptional regulator [Actinomycetospora sp. DW7H6]
MSGVDGHDGRTRDLIVRRLLEHGPTTAMDLAGEFGLSGAAVRRHLDALVADGTVVTRDAPRASGRGRGRPARQHLLTEQGRRRAGRGEADVAELAVAALRELAGVAGEDAVRAFARRRILGLLAEHREGVEAQDDRAARVEALAGALSREGYAASSRPSSGTGAQLCQHHCPVAGVAAEFPQLCEAETEVFAELLGTHVQRLSTIARGDAACTTHVPQPTTTDVKGRQVV